MFKNDQRYPVSKFLVKSSLYRKQVGTTYGTVYSLVNLTNGSRYVGSTIDINRRAGEYIRGYYSETAGSTSNQIIFKAMREAGIENFRMEKLIDCNSALELAYWELYYIRKFNTFGTPNGYNLSLNVSARVNDESRVYKRVGGVKYSAERNRKHSLEIIAINPELREFYLSDSCALFGRVRANDQYKNVANACKGMNRYKGGWYFYYTAIVPFSFKISTKLSPSFYLATGIEKGRGNHEYKTIAKALFQDSHAYLCENKYKLFELRYNDTEESGYLITEIVLQNLTENV